MSTSPIRQIVQQHLPSSIPSEYEYVPERIIADLEDALSAIIDSLRTYASQRGLDGSEQDRLLENVGLGFYTHPVEEDAEDEPEDEEYDTTSGRLAALEQGLERLTRLAERHLGRV